MAKVKSQQLKAKCLRHATSEVKRLLEGYELAYEYTVGDEEDEVGYDTVGDCEVRTLGVPHFDRFEQRFETVVFSIVHDVNFERIAETRERAVEHHKEAIAWVEAGRPAATGGYKRG